MIRDWLFFGPGRWYVVRVGYRLPHGRIYYWLLDQLYPNDAKITFREDGLP